MSSEETEIRQLTRLFRGHWKLILAPAALAAVSALAWFGLIASPGYEATVLLAIHPRLDGDHPYGRSIRIQRSLIESDTVLQRTAEALAADRPGSETAALGIGRRLSTRILDMKDGAGLSPVLALSARGATPERAAETANTWARIAIAESRAMFERGAPGEQAWLDEMAGRIEAARRTLAALEEDRERRLVEGLRPAQPEQGKRELGQREIAIARNRVNRLTIQAERHTIATLLKHEEPLTVMAPAVAPRTPEPRRLPTKVATAAFLGGMLGLMIALARTSHLARPSHRR